MNLTRREALARGGGLLAALGLGRLLPSRAGPEPPQAPVEDEDQVVEDELGEVQNLVLTTLRTPDWADSLVYKLQGLYGEHWVDVAQMVCPPGVEPRFTRDQVPPDVRYVRVSIETTPCG